MQDPAAKKRQMRAAKDKRDRRVRPSSAEASRRFVIMRSSACAPRMRATVCRWRWRRTDVEGSVQSSLEEFELFYDCVSAARGAGYDPFFAGRRIVCATRRR
jgi:hypothetical protein